jgi:hypothetical protein
MYENNGREKSALSAESAVLRLGEDQRNESGRHATTIGGQNWKDGRRQMVIAARTVERVHPALPWEGSVEAGRRSW